MRRTLRPAQNNSMTTKYINKINKPPSDRTRDDSCRVVQGTDDAVIQNLQSTPIIIQCTHSRSTEVKLEQDDNMDTVCGMSTVIIVFSLVKLIYTRKFTYSCSSYYNVLLHAYTLYSVRNYFITNSCTSGVLVGVSRWIILGSMFLLLVKWSTQNVYYAVLTV